MRLCSSLCSIVKEVAVYRVFFFILCGFIKGYKLEANKYRNMKFTVVLDKI